MSEELEVIEIDSISDAEPVNPSLFNDIVVFGTDWTSETIEIQIQKGNILLNPTFQRRVAWLDDRKSQFIESLIFGVPVPQILLAQQSDGKYIVLDGKQRLTAIEEFFSNKLKLTGLKLDSSLNGLTFDDLKKDKDFYYNQLTNRPIRTTVIKNCKHESILHQIFLRVNTGSVPLSPQELRQALHPGEFVRFANEFTAQSESLKTMLGLKEPDYRMRDVDIFVRSIGIFNFSDNYTGSMGPFLDDCCKKLNKLWITESSELIRQASEFNNAIDFVQKCFGETTSFRVWANGNFNRIINRAVVDVMIYYFMFPEIRRVFSSKHQEVVSAFKEVSMDRDFSRSISFSTNSSSAMRTRFSLWGKKLSTLDKTVTIKIPFGHL